MEAYKDFLNNINFDIQILIKSQKENLEKIYSKLDETQFLNFSKDTKINDNILELKNNYINHLKYLNDNFSITNKKYYLIISLNIGHTLSNINTHNSSNSNSTFLSFFNFFKNDVKNINTLSNIPNISNKLDANLIPFKVLEEFKDINSIIYNTLTRACRNIKQLNTIEILNLLNENFNFSGLSNG